MNEPAFHLPFHRLFVQLQNSGIFVGPAERLRVQQLLADGKAEWANPEGREALKYEIAPLLCRNRAEQEQFYKVYDDFLKTLAEPLVVPPPPPPWFFWEKCKKWLPWVLGGLVLAAAIWAFVPKRQIEISLLEINGRSTLKIGETATLINTTNAKDTAGIDFVWKVYSEQDVLQYRDSSQVLRYTAPDPGKKEDAFSKSIYLEAYDRKSGDTIGSKMLLEGLVIVCNNAPDPQGDIRMEGKNQIGQKLLFSAPPNLKKQWLLEWRIEHGEVLSNKAVFSHVFEKSGTYSVVLDIIDTTQNGFCVSTLSTNAQISDPIPQLSPLPLLPDELKPFWAYTLLTKILAGLALLLSLFLFWKWWHRPETTEPLPDPQVSPSLRRAFEPKDRSPYAIPYRSNNSQVRLAAEQLELANILRRRQAGQQSNLHIPQTIAATIEKIGFAELRFATNTRPTHYLFLIDLQNEASHQAQLFRYLVEMLMGQEVLGDVLFYKNDFSRFWNRLHPEGLSLEQVALHFGDRRLVVFGDGYRLVSDTDGPEVLHSAWADGLKRWPQRLLVTPTPVRSWNYQEARLYRVFAIFHADLSGLMQAAQFVDKGLDDENLPPTFAEWENQCLRGRVDVDTARSWRSPEQHRAYLREAGAEKLYPWLRALAVYPDLNWNVSIAIGKALGIDVQYEHLLLLARIPWLQEGALKTALWRAWWQEMPKTEEKTAREAIRAELQAVAEKCADGYADQKVQTRLALQDFALRSGDADAQDALRFILSHIRPTPLFNEELDLVVARHQPGFPKQDGPTGSTVAAFLERAPKVSRPLFTPHFWWGTLAFLVFLFPILVKPDRFARFYPNPNADGLKGGWLVRQDRQAEDEAVRLNNEAVQVWEEKAPVPNTFAGVPDYEDAPPKSNYARLLLKQALDIRSDYPLAKTNRDKAYYNDGLYFLNTLDPARAIRNFRLLLNSDSLQLDAAKALAIAFYKNQQVDSACYWINRVVAAQPDYINWLLAKGECGDAPCFTVANIENNLGLRNQSLKQKEYDQLAQNLNPTLERRTLIQNIPLGATVALLDSTPLSWKIRFNGNTGYVAKFYKNKPTLLPCGQTGNPLGDRDGDGVSDENDQCPDKKGLQRFEGCPDTVTLLEVKKKAFVPPDMAFVKGHTFQMGSNDYDVEKPIHPVTLPDFEMGRTEVTVAQYLAFCDETKSHYPEWLETGSKYHIETGKDDYYKKVGMNRANGTRPIVGVSWDDAVGYCNWISQKTGKNYRLPTEAEWEFAARGGTLSKGYPYAGSNDLNEVGWFFDNSGSQTHPVGQKKANELGLYDMSGNVWEWCQDWYKAYKDIKKPIYNPTGPATGSRRVHRGGSWYNGSTRCRVAGRNVWRLGFRNNGLGFRLARTY